LINLLDKTPACHYQRCADLSLWPIAAYCQSFPNAGHSMPYRDRSFGIKEPCGIDRPDLTRRSSSRAACLESLDPVRHSGTQSDHSHIIGSDPVVTLRSPDAHVDNTAPEMAVSPFPPAQPSSGSTALREGDIDTRTRAFSCPLEFCQRPFRRLEHLKRHVRTHTRERPYFCGQCGRSFSRQDNLLQHVRTHSRNGRGDKSPRTRLSSGSAIPCDVTPPHRSTSERPPQCHPDDSPRCDPRATGWIRHSASDATGGQNPRSDRLATAPPDWA
jgi:hypothetical protein